jgi:hypothetical protein
MVAPFGLRPKGTTIARIMPIAHVLAAQGATVRVCIPPWDDPLRAGQRWAEGDRVEVVHTHLARSQLRALIVFKEVFSELRRFQPDVVHAFKPIGYSGAVAQRLSKSCPLSLTLPRQGGGDTGATGLTSQRPQGADVVDPSASTWAAPSSNPAPR